MTARFVVGIDLGTTNSVVAFSPLDADRPQVELLPIPQLVAPSTLEPRTSLPSFTYLAPPTSSALPYSTLLGAKTATTPWAKSRDVNRQTLPKERWVEPNHGFAIVASIDINPFSPGELPTKSLVSLPSPRRAAISNISSPPGRTRIPTLRCATNRSSSPFLPPSTPLPVN